MDVVFVIFYSSISPAFSAWAFSFFSLCFLYISYPVAPLAANVEEDTQKTAEEAPKAEEAVNIADEAVPLADVAVESEHAKMSWWWWLIILILGATGYEMYKKLFE